MIRLCKPDEIDQILEIINESATAYRGVIPPDRMKDPYMPLDELQHEIEDGVIFYGLEAAGRLVGVMGIQDKGEVTLIRHSYIRTDQRRKGVGSRLLHELVLKTINPILIGTWADATWAVDFYCKNGFELTPEAEKNRLLRKYWNIPDRQVETSVVLKQSGK